MEPLRIDSQTEPSKAEKSEKSGESTSKKKRERAARHLRVVPTESVGGERRSETKRESSAEIKKEPASLGELFEIKAAKAEKDAEPTQEVVDDSGSLTKEGRQAIASTLSEARLSKIEQHSPEDEITLEIAADLGAESLHAKVADGMDIEAAAAEVQAELGVTAAEVETVEADIPSRPPEAVPEDVESEENEAELEPEDWPEEKPLFNLTEATPEAEDDETPSAAAGSTAPSGTATAGSASPPPGGPTPPFGGSPPSGPNLPPSSGPTGPGGNHNLYPTPVLSGNLNAPPSTEIYDSGNPAVTALIGYLIGRRRGRRKAERRAAKDMRSYERKVKHQVEDIDWQLKAKEQQIRKLAADKTRQERDMYVIPRPRSSDKEQKPFNAERRPAPEANWLHGGVKAQERLGHILVNAAELPAPAVAAGRVEKESAGVRPTETVSQKTSEQLPRQLTERQVETLNRSELLAMSEKIVVDGSSLRQIYETHLIGERGLRRLVAEHLRGGDVKKILRREIVEHEIDFERDPAVRDVPTTRPGGGLLRSTTTTGGKAALDKLVQQASAGFGDSNPQAAYYKARAAYEAQEQLEEKNRRRVVDVGLATVIAVLVAAVVILYFTRH